MGAGPAGSTVGGGGAGDGGAGRDKKDKAPTWDGAEEGTGVGLTAGSSNGSTGASRGSRGVGGSNMPSFSISAATSFSQFQLSTPVIYPSLRPSMYSLRL